MRANLCRGYSLAELIFAGIVAGLFTTAQPGCGDFEALAPDDRVVLNAADIDEALVLIAAAVFALFFGGLGQR